MDLTCVNLEPIILFLDYIISNFGDRSDDTQKTLKTVVFFSVNLAKARDPCDCLGTIS